MHEGETVWVEAPVDHAPHGTCVWGGEAFEDAGDFRCIAMLTKDEDGDADWLSGEFIHGTCDYDRADATDEALAASIAHSRIIYILYSIWLPEALKHLKIHM